MMCYITPTAACRAMPLSGQSMPALPPTQGVLLHTLVANMEEAAEREGKGTADGAKGDAAAAAARPSLFLNSGHDR